MWDGQVFYTYTEGPRAGKRDTEFWADGKMQSSQKYYGKVLPKIKCRKIDVISINIFREKKY